MAATKAATRRGPRITEATDGYLNLAGFAAAVERTWGKEPNLALLYIDLDGLFGLNEAAGHEAGDRVIAAAGGALRKTAETERWTLGRIGGDEFALLAPGLSVEAAFLRAEALRREIDAAIAKALPRGPKVTASIGVAAAPRDAKEAGQLRRKANLALYAAKEQGGDAVALAPSEDMVLKSSYYDVAQLARLKGLAERQKKKEAVLLREALDDLLRKYARD